MNYKVNYQLTIKFTNGINYLYYSNKKREVKLMSNRKQILSEIAYMFYEEGLTQVEISKRMNLSRPTVAAMLKEAKEIGIVKITIQSDDYTLLRKQTLLCEKYGLESVQITPYKGEELTKQNVGLLCANFIEERIQNIHTLGIGWGTTLYEFVNNAKYLSAPTLKIIPLVGGGGHSNVNFHSNVLAFSLAKKYDCKANFFYAPAFAEDIEMKKTFERSGLIKEVMEEGKKVDIAVVGVGNPQTSSTYRLLQSFSEDELDEIREKKIIGDILTSFFDSEGNVHQTHITDRMLGQSLEDLMSTKEVVIVASGMDKFLSLKGLLNLKFVNHLIIDDLNANQLLLD